MNCIGSCKSGFGCIFIISSRFIHNLTLTLDTQMRIVQQSAHAFLGSYQFSSVSSTSQTSSKVSLLDCVSAGHLPHPTAVLICLAQMGVQCCSNKQHQRRFLRSGDLADWRLHGNQRRRRSVVLCVGLCVARHSNTIGRG
jgi:hypothetical protein